MKCLGGEDSKAALRVASYDRSSNSAPSIPSAADLEKDSASLHRDLAIAREVQRASFPQRPPGIPGLSFASFYKPVLCVGVTTMMSFPYRMARGVSVSAMYLEKESGLPW